MPGKSKKKIECIFTIDAGTQSIRAALIDLKGFILEIEKTSIEPYYSVNPGWSEQDPEYYWKMLCLTCKKLFHGSSIDKKSIQGVTLTTQRNTVINVDKNGKPLRPAIVWLDQRKADSTNWPPFYIKAALKVIKMHDFVVSFYQDCEANWIRQNQPEIWKKTDKFLFLSGFFINKLTGEYLDSIASMIGYLPMDYKNFSIAKKYDLKWKTFPIDKSKLPGIVNPSDILGRITKKASKETGIPEGLTVIASAADKACEVLGSGCLTPDIACLSYGTTATIETTNNKYIELIPYIPPYPSAVPGSWNTEVMIFRGYWMVSWFKKEFGLREQQLAKKKKITPEALFDELIKDISPGSMGLTLQPFWSPGVRNPGPEAKGAIIGFGDVHTRAHIYRAILEGLAYSLKEGAIQTEKKNRVKIEKVRVSGGGSQSEEAMQITADIFDMNAERPHTYETSALGAAIDAAVGLKLHSDFNIAVKEMTRVKDIYEPIPKNRDIYKELFENVYQRMYNRMKPLYDEIQNITGYPEKIS